MQASHAPPAVGLALIDKRAGLSSHGALSELKRVYATRRIGHAGTLDPFATGLLCALVGPATRLAVVLSGLPKRYRATFRFGVGTDTLDVDGAEVASGPVPAYESILGALPAFVGKVRQRPPDYSAVHVAGRRAYQLAREGAPLELPERTVMIQAIEPIEYASPDLRVELICAAGTYVRSVARDLAKSLGTFAHVRELRRLDVGPFNVAEAKDAATLQPTDLLSPYKFLGRLEGVDTCSVVASHRADVEHGRPPRTSFFSPLEGGARYIAAFSDTQELLALLDRPDGDSTPLRYAAVFASATAGARR
jgi:tRNA pseudouridine55 synthase